MEKSRINIKDIISDYNRIYSGPGIKTNSGYYRWLVKLLHPESNTKLLDISCGERIFLREVSRKFKSIKSFG